MIENLRFAAFTHKYYINERNEGAAKAAKDEHYCYIFIMAVTVAHEVVHVFIGFLTGDNWPDTPPEVQARGFADHRVGESGRFWEDALFGGGPECVEADVSVLGWRQAGLPYLVDNHNYCEPISRRWIADFVHHREWSILSTLIALRSIAAGINQYLAPYRIRFPSACHDISLNFGS